MIVKEGHSSYGFCYIEDCSVGFMVHVGSSVYGPYTNFNDAIAQFRQFCAD